MVGGTKSGWRKLIHRNRGKGGGSESDLVQVGGGEKYKMAQNNTSNEEQRGGVENRSRHKLMMAQILTWRKIIHRNHPDSRGVAGRKI